MRWVHWFYTVPLWLRSAFRRNRVEHDLDDEIRFHVEREISENVARGLTAEEARNAALCTFGGIEQHKEECRDALRVRFIEEFQQNLRFAWRRLRSSPGLTVSAGIALALGIGANTAVFTAVDALLFRPLPVEASGRLVSFNNGTAVSFSYPAYRDFRDRNDVLAGLTAYRVVPMNISAPAAGNFRTWGYEATGNYFDLLGVKPFLGHLFHSEDDTQPGAHPVLVLSYRCWQRRFEADPNIVSRTVKVNGLDYTILGVAPARFKGTETFFNPDVWVPMSMQAQVEPGYNWLESRTATNIWMLGRLKEGVSRRQAEASLNRIASQLVREHPATDEGMAVQLSAPGLVGNALRGPVTAFGTAHHVHRRTAAVASLLQPGGDAAGPGRRPPQGDRRSFGPWRVSSATGSAVID